MYIVFVRACNAHIVMFMYMYNMYMYRYVYMYMYMYINVPEYSTVKYSIVQYSSSVITVHTVYIYYTILQYSSSVITVHTCTYTTLYC